MRCSGVVLCGTFETNDKINTKLRGSFAGKTATRQGSKHNVLLMGFSQRGSESVHFAYQNKQ